MDDRGRSDRKYPNDYDSPTTQSARRGPSAGRPFTPEERLRDERLRDDRYSPGPYDRAEERRNLDPRRTNGSSEDTRLNNIPRVNPPSNGVKPIDTRDSRYDNRTDRDLYNDRSDPAYRRSTPNEAVDNRYGAEGARQIGLNKPRVQGDDVRVEHRLSERDSGTYEYDRRTADKPGVRAVVAEQIRNVPEPDYSPPTDTGTSASRKHYTDELPSRHIDSRSPEPRVSNSEGLRTSPPDRTKGIRERDYNGSYDRYSSQPPIASSTSSRDGYIGRNGKENSSGDYLDRSPRAPSPSHRTPAATAPISLRRARLDTGVWRGDSQSSEQSEAINVRAGLANHHHPPSKHHKHKRASAKTHRQHRSPSSSEEEIRSTPECTSCEELEMESESFSEKGRPNPMHQSLITAGSP